MKAAINVCRWIVVVAFVAGLQAPGQEPVPEKKSEEKKPEASPSDKFEKEGGPAVVFALPKGWKAAKGASAMRLAEVTVPGKEAATCTVYWFGEQGAGPIDANIDRWVGQFETDQKPVKDTLKLVEGFKATRVELGGRYVAPVTPGAPEKNDKPDWRLLGAILETPGGPLYLKLTGPNATVTAARDDFKTWIQSFRTAPKAAAK